jgi:hypothetical protein
MQRVEQKLLNLSIKKNFKSFNEELLKGGWEIQSMIVRDDFIIVLIQRPFASSEEALGPLPQSGHP